MSEDQRMLAASMLLLFLVCLLAVTASEILVQFVKHAWRIWRKR